MAQQQALETGPSAETEADYPSHLMPHQKVALGWMLRREAQTPCGGILADEAGLGQNETVISLVIKTLAARNTQKEIEKPLKSGEKNEDLIPSACTLVICPPPLIDQYVKEVKRQCKLAGQLNIYLYRGKDWERDPEKLAEYDMVIASYSLVRREHKSLLKDGKGVKASKGDEASTGSKDQPALLRVIWDRIILDHADMIKNPESQRAIAICQLKARARWAVTPYPIQNSTMDMWSLLRFILDDDKLYEEWKTQVEAAAPEAKSLEKLHTLVKSLLLRRTRDQKTSSGNPIVSLPEKKIHFPKIDLLNDEREIYDQYRSQSKNKSNKTNILVILLRLRQCCCHLSLLKALPDQESCETDGIELDPVSQMKEVGLVESDQESGQVKPKTTLYGSFFSSTKITYVIDKLKEIRTAGLAEKSILVSQWTGMLDAVASHLEEPGFQCLRIDGDVPQKERDELMEDYNNNPKGPKVMLVSLTVSGVGLNLSGANHLFFLNMHWNPAVEDKAHDWIYRAGQTRTVHIYKIVCSDTIEERISKLQTVKRQLANDVLTGPGKGAPGQGSPGQGAPGPGEEEPGEETPGEETPGEETPGQGAPGEETPGEETPGEETPGEETPGEETPHEETPGEETPGEETPGKETPGEEEPGEEAPDEEEELGDEDLKLLFVDQFENENEA